MNNGLQIGNRFNVAYLMLIINEVKLEHKKNILNFKRC